MPKRTPKSETTVTNLRDVREAQDAEGNVTKSPTLAELTPERHVTKPKRAKQGEFPGIEAPSHPELDLLMEGIDECATAIGTARQRMGELKTQAQQKAAALKLDNYRHPTAVPELVLTITEGSTKVKVVRAKSTPADEPETTE